MNLAQMYDLILLALAIWREARGEGSPAKIAVAWSIRNRVSAPRWWGKDYPSVILCHEQFSSFNVGDPNVAKFPVPGDTSWQDALTCANAVYLGHISDPTMGATSYYSGDGIAPSWARELAFTVNVGAFHFYKIAVATEAPSVV